MTDMKRILIGSVELDKTKSGKAVVNLWSTDTRLQFPALRLFDLSALSTVGIDPDSLGAERIHRRLWAYYTESDKLTSKGNPYLNVEYLEAIDAPASSTSAAVGDPAILAELRQIRDYLALLVEAQGLDPHRPRPSDAPAAEPTPNGNGADDGLDAFFESQPERITILYADGDPVSDNMSEREAYAEYVKAEGHPPLDVHMLRNWVRQRNGKGHKSAT